MNEEKIYPFEETTDERFRKFIIAECRRIDRFDVYNWVADDELKIKQLQQENQQLKDKINTYENPEDLTLMFMYCEEKAKDKIKELQATNESLTSLVNSCQKEIRQLRADLEMYENGVYYSSENDKLKEVIEEVREVAQELKLHYQQHPTMIPDVKLKKLLQILDKAKGDNKHEN